MRLNPVLESLGTYPFVRLDEAKAAAVARGIELIDFGIGEPREETPAFIRAALAEALEPGVDLPEGRRAAGAARGDRALGRRGASARRAGSRRRRSSPRSAPRRPIFHMAEVVGGEAVAVTTPGYPVGARGALFAGREVVELPLDPAARLAAGPRRARRRDARPPRPALAQLPQQPDGRGRAARAAGARRRAGARARLRPGLRRGLLRDLVRRRRAGQRPAARRPAPTWWC